MPGRLRPKGICSSTLAVLILYGLVMVAGPFLHHDFACHQNSRAHCNSCTTGQSAQKVGVSEAPADLIHLVVDTVDAYTCVGVESPELTSLSGRSPPV